MNDDGPEYEEAFFETTDENILASGMGQAFVDYTIMVLETTREWEERRNMADFMAKDLLNWHQDIHCAKAVRICPHAGMCMPGYDTKSTLDKSATYCCRSTTSIGLLATCMYVILISTFPRYVLIVMQEQTLPAQLASIAKTKQMANTFICYTIPRPTSQCSLEAGIAKAAIMALMIGTLVALPMLAPAAGVADVGAVAGAEAGAAAGVEASTLGSAVAGVGGALSEVGAPVVVAGGLESVEATTAEITQAGLDADAEALDAGVSKEEALEIG